jgi:hypothetical protein
MDEEEKVRPCIFINTDDSIELCAKSIGIMWCYFSKSKEEQEQMESALKRHQGECEHCKRIANK